MAEAPQNAVEAAAKAVHDALCPAHPGHCDGEPLAPHQEAAKAALAAAEGVWPHDPQARDPASTLSSSTERQWSPVHRAPVSAHGFGFTRDVMAGVRRD